jgi:hypothetical protein
MVGAALARQMAPNGALAYTLYVNTATNIAFIHMLPLASEANGPLFARCVDLPNGRSAELMDSYTLTLSADGTTLYAINAALGLASGITVHPDGPFGDKIDISATFYPALPSSATTNQHRPLASVLARDQRTLYAAGPQGIWAFNAASLKLQRVYLADQSFTGLAASADGKTLYAVSPTSGITLLDLASGQSVMTLRSPAQSPLSIAWMRG